MRLYGSTRRMTMIFCASIAGITLVLLILRLTLLGDITASIAMESPDVAAAMQGGQIGGDSNFPYNLNPKIYFPKATSKGDVLILNPESNKYLLSINIVLPETKDSLYWTGSLAPGTAIDTARLSAAGQKLPEGTYQCVAEVSAIDPQTQAKIVSDEVPVTIYIGVKPQNASNNNS